MINGIVSFGWNAKTHQAITSKAIDFIEENLDTKVPHKKKLIKYCIKPDVDETFPLRSGHFYCPTTGRSYIDEGKHNADYIFKEHIEKALKHLKKGENKKAFKQVGRALHYSQDVCVPFHTEDLTVRQAIGKAPKHVWYEKYVGKHIEKILDSITSNFDLSTLTTSKTINKEIVTNNASFSHKFLPKLKMGLFVKSTSQDVTEKAFTSTVEVLYNFVKTAAKYK